MAVFSLRPSAAGEDRLKKATEREKGKKRKKQKISKKEKDIQKAGKRGATRKQLTEGRWNLLAVPQVLQGNHASKNLFSLKSLKRLYITLNDILIRQMVRKNSQ